MTSQVEAPAVKVAFASAKEALIPAFLEHFDAIDPDAQLFVVSEFQPPRGRWIPYRFDRSIAENYRRVKSALGHRPVRFVSLVLQPGTLYAPLRLLALSLAPHRTLFYNENLGHFMLRPAAVPTIGRHLLWRFKSFLKFQLRPGGTAYTWAWRARHPSALRRPFHRQAALLAGRLAVRRRRQARSGLMPALNAQELTEGISVVIPSRDGRELLERLLPVLVDELRPYTAEIIVVDNGSRDGTADFLRSQHPGARIVLSPEPLSFARAINRGLAVATHSRVCLLNNDMHPHPGFFAPLLKAFGEVPDLFCATAQIFFPEGQRREETGKAVARTPKAEGDYAFPVECLAPLAGEDLSYVLYGSGGCSMFDTARLKAIGGLSESFEPAYVEDLDLGVRGWQCGWPTVFVAGAKVTHRHRTTTARFYTSEQLEAMVEENYLLFLSRSIRSPELFKRLWRQAINRLDCRVIFEDHHPSLQALERAATIAAAGPDSGCSVIPDEMIFGIGSGDVAVFPGRGARHKHTVIVASCYIPFPLAHGGAVRMFNLMRHAAADFGQVLITFVDELHPPARELLDICVEVVQVRRLGSHLRTDRNLPDAVEDFDSQAFRAALRQTIQKWQPAVVQLEFTQMAQYARDCKPAKTVLVEHDVTIDLYSQLLEHTADYDTKDQLQRWVRFEKAAWHNVDAVVVMSERDRKTVGNDKCIVLPNGVDLHRFQPGSQGPDHARLLFIGSFAHLPNVVALDFFLREIWPHLSDLHPVLHIIAGSRHEYHLERWKTRVQPPLETPGVLTDGFVSDVRPAYRQAQVVVAPLLASAGTNIKVLEAMAMGKAVVSTPGGVNGLNVISGGSVLVENEPKHFADSVRRLIQDSGFRADLERNARATVERLYDWRAIAAGQRKLYEKLLKS